MRFAVFSLFLFLRALQPCEATTYINAGESIWASFETMDWLPDPTTGWVIDHGPDKLTAGEQYRVSFFEESILGLPIVQQTIGTTSQNGLNGFIFFGYSSLGHFQDSQGAVRIDMLSGSLSIDEVIIVTRIDGQDYAARMASFNSIVAPEPSVAGLLLTTIALLSFSRRRDAQLTVAQDGHSRNH